MSEPNNIDHLFQEFETEGDQEVKNVSNEFLLSLETRLGLKVFH